MLRINFKLFGKVIIIADLFWHEQDPSEPQTDCWLSGFRFYFSCVDNILQNEGLCSLLWLETCQYFEWSSSVEVAYMNNKYMNNSWFHWGFEASLVHLPRWNSVPNTYTEMVKHETGSDTTTPELKVNRRESGVKRKNLPRWTKAFIICELTYLTVNLLWS